MPTDLPSESESRPIETLHYAGPFVPSAPPAWVYVVVSIYAGMLVGVLSVPALTGILSEPGPAVFAYFIIGVLFLGGLLLVLVPIRARRRRWPLSRRSIWLPLAGSAILAAALFLGVGSATYGLLGKDVLNNDNPENAQLAMILFLSVGLLWLGWIVFFWLVSRSLDPVSFSVRLYKSVLAGSLLELLIAVPMHIVVRRRHECCADVATGFAICLGAMVAIIALGPGIYFLFHRRWYATYRGTLRSEQNPRLHSDGSAKND